MSATPSDNSAPTDTRLQLADLTIDPVGARVTRGADEIPLPRLSWELLKVLVDLTPGIVTTETLLNRVWPGLVVNPETVSQRVKLLRSALGDDPRQPRYIAVVRGRGWRLASPVVPVAAAAEPLPLPAAPVDVAESTPHRRPRFLAAVLAVVAMLGALLLWQSRSETQVSALPGSAGAVARPSIAVRPFQTLGTREEDRALALGVAETVWWQLFSRGDLSVIHRNSSFSDDIARMDVRGAGEHLGVAYVLDGSVQRIASERRVTAHLVDTASGKSVWTREFTGSIHDVFAVPDEIVLQVAQALGLDVASTQQLAGPGPKSEAWLEFALARNLLKGGRVTDLAEAKQHLLRAIELDADYAQAYVELGVTVLRQAEFDPRGDRRVAFEAAKLEAGQYFDQAIAIDPKNGPARLQRAYLMNFSNLEAAEREYRLILAMAPNDAAAYYGLAQVIYEDPQRYAEALAALEKARHLDPRELSYDIAKSGFLFFGRADPDAALSIVQKVVDEHGKNALALSRMAGISASTGSLAQAIYYDELALENDSLLEWARRHLSSVYITLGDTRAAQAVLSEAPGDIPARGLSMLVESAQWRAAGELAHAGRESDAVLPFDEPAVAIALRKYARLPGEFESALAALEDFAYLRWSTDGEPEFPYANDMRLYVVAVGDLLLQSGQEERGRLVLQRLVAQIEDSRTKLQRGDLWTNPALAAALALLGDSDRAIEVLGKSVKDGFLVHRHRLMLDLEPAYDSLRGRPDFLALQAEVSRKVKEQQAELQKLRSQGLVPKR